MGSKRKNVWQKHSTKQISHENHIRIGLLETYQKNRSWLFQVTDIQSSSIVVIVVVVAVAVLVEIVLVLVTTVK